jgi:hypothetical protein
MDFSSMMFMSFGGQGPWVQCKHMYYILQYAMFSKVREPFNHPSSSSNEVHRLLGDGKVLELK